MLRLTIKNTEKRSSRTENEQDGKLSVYFLTEGESSVAIYATTLCMRLGAESIGQG